MRRSLAQEIEERVGTCGFSRSIEAAAEHWLTFLRAKEIVEDHERHFGPPTQREMDEASGAWRGS